MNRRAANNELLIYVHIIYYYIYGKLIPVLYATNLIEIINLLAYDMVMQRRLI